MRLKCETRNSCFLMKPRQTVIMPVTFEILLSSQRILGTPVSRLWGGGVGQFIPLNFNTSFQFVF